MTDPVQLVLETGAGVPGANSFVSLAYANQYFSVHPFYSDAWAALTDAVKTNRLIFASGRISNMILWGGQPTTLVQGLAWPRLGASDPYGCLYSSSLIPDQLMQAVCEYAYWIGTPLANVDQPTDSAGLTSVSVDVITVKFAASTPRPAVPQAVAALLRGLGNSYFGSRVRRVQVGLA